MYKNKHINLVLIKLKVEGLSIKSNWIDIEKCLSKTVMPIKNVAVAKYLREKQNLKQ